MKNIVLLSLCLCSASFALETNYAPVSSLPTQQQAFVMNNRPLAKVNGKMISLMDVVKKMDLFIYEYYPDLKDSVGSVLQLYNSQWKSTLMEMINSELMLAEAEEKEIKVSDGDVREEMEARFGPNIMTTLDKLGLQYEEARKIVHAELIVRQMNWYNIYSRAYQVVTPKTIKEGYIAFCEHNPPKDEWKYQVVSVRGKNKDLCNTVANRAAKLLEAENIEIASLPDMLKNAEEGIPTGISVSVSQEFVSDDKSLASQHKSILTSLKEGSFSLPVEQTSRVDNSIVYRIFHLKSHQKGQNKEFQELFRNIKDDLTDTAVKKEKEIYLSYLYKKFGFSEEQLKELIPEHYQPFLPG